MDTNKFSTGTEKKLLKKQELEEEQAFREKVSVPLQAHLDEQRQKYLQLQENTVSKIKSPPGQVSGLYSLKRLEVIEEEPELSEVDETSNEKTQRAKNAEATIIAGSVEHERLQKIKKVSE